MVLNILNKPFPINTWRWYWLRGAGFGTFIFLFLFLFKPFRLDLYDTYQLLYTAAVYGLTTGIVIFSGSLFLTKFIAPRIDEEKWTLAKQILWNTLLMVCIAILNVLVTQLMYNISLPLSWYFTMLKWVLMLGILPVAFAELITYNHFLHRHLKNAADISQIMGKSPVQSPTYPECSSPENPGNNLPTPGSAAPAKSPSHISNHPNHIPGKYVKFFEKQSIASPPVVLTGDNQGDKLALNPNCLLAVQALDNYVNVFWERNGVLQTTMLRSTLTDLAAQMECMTNIFRCHRGWLVNIDKVTAVDGNAQGLKLSLELLTQHVPVSRGNIAAYRQLTGEKQTSIEREMEFSN